MKHFILWCVLLCSSQACLALEPYLLATKVVGPDLSAQLDQVDKKLQAAGFTVVGRHTPLGLPGYASLVVTDPEVLTAVRAIGGSAIVAAAIRVGLQRDGTVSYMNPEYWYRAYLRGQYPAAQAAVQSVQQRLVAALGEGHGFGGHVPEGELSNYRYMFGMERFDSGNSLLTTHASFEEALKSVQDNLAKEVGATRKVYEVVVPGSKIAVFGVAMNSVSDGEGWYRIALAWPALGMGQFMRIVNAPEAIRGTLARVAGAADK